MYGILVYIYHRNQPNVGIYAIHGSYGDGWELNHQLEDAFLWHGMPGGGWVQVYLHIDDSRGFGPCLQVLKGPRNARCNLGEFWDGFFWLFKDPRIDSTEGFFTSRSTLLNDGWKENSLGVTPKKPQQKDAKLSTFHLLDDFAKTFQQMEWIQSGNSSQWRHRVLFCSQETMIWWVFCNRNTFTV